MLIIVIGLACVDFLTGFIKAYVNDDVQSRKMRKGGLNKLGEITVMSTVIGLNIGMEFLGKYYDEPELTRFTGGAVAFTVFCYIVIMEIISVLENYAAVNSEAVWVSKIVKKLKNIDYTDKEE
jgi:uncharacterized membrane protein